MDRSNLRRAALARSADEAFTPEIASPMFSQRYGPDKLMNATWRSGGKGFKIVGRKPVTAMVVNSCGPFLHAGRALNPTLPIPL